MSLTNRKTLKKTLKVTNTGGDCGSKSVDIDKLEIGKCYSITINPIVQCDFAEDRLKEWMGEMAVVLNNRYLKHVDLKLYPEVSPTGRLHFHGTIVFHNLAYWALYGIQRIMKIGHINIDTIGNIDKEESKSYNEILVAENLDAWLCYCKKQEFIWAPIMGTSGVHSYPVEIKWPNHKLENTMGIKTKVECPVCDKDMTVCVCID